MLWYVTVIGPYDGSFVGPFQIQQEAKQWAKEMGILKGHIFDFYVSDEDKVRESLVTMPAGIPYDLQFCNPVQWEHDNVIQA